MDYSEDLIKASEESDFAYARWYSQVPQERKARFFQSGFDFVVEKVKEDVKRENPFCTEAEIRWRFIELTQKEAYPEEVFAFIKEQMEKRIEEEWKQRFRKMKDSLGWTYEDMAHFMGAASGESLKASVSRGLPAFARLAVCVFERFGSSD